MSSACRDINELLPAAKKACRLFMKKCGEARLEVFITETYRSQARQNELYNQGRTTPGQIVTWTKKSKHTDRLAWDIACIGKELYDISVLNRAGQIGRSLGITWGGDWKTPDKPHFEVKADWEEPKEEEEMAEKRYGTIEEVPEWGKAAIQELINKGCFADVKALNLSEDMVRVFVILARNN